MKKNIRIGIADRHKFVHDGIRLFCEHQSNNFQIIFHAFTCDEIERNLSLEKIDVLVMDVNFPLAEGVHLCEKIREKYKELRILVFAEYDDISLMAKLFKCGVDCYLKKTEGFDSLRYAITQVHEVGYCYLYDMSAVLKTSPMEVPPPESKKHKSLQLSSKEKAVIALIREELTTKQIARELGLHVKTIEFHKRNIIEKSNSKKILGAIDYLVSHNIIPAKKADPYQKKPA
ncbi:MAG: response regulator transcription factor [Flavobacteriales bacterium]|nr:response regulator transcription factor [Flavobacteriales bacterium]